LLRFDLKILKVTLSIIHLLCCYNTYGQHQSFQPDSIPYSSNIPYVKSKTSDISFTGFYRFMGFIRNQKHKFSDIDKYTSILVGDAYREPMLLLKMKGLTRDKISFGADFMINSLYKGVSQDLNRELTLELGLNLRTSIATKYGNFNIKTGGVSWYRQSRLTVWGNRSFNRTSIYDRRPQTPLTTNPEDRYSKYYNSGLIDQGLRYGSRAFQGIFLEGLQLPHNFFVKAVVGKSNFNRSSIESSDNFTACFKLKKSVNDSLAISYQHLNSFADIDYLGIRERKYYINTFEIDKKWDNIRLQIEAGIGQYSDADDDMGNGEAFIANLKTEKSSVIPLDIQIYRISPQFINLTGNFLNTTVLEVFPNVEGVGASVRLPFMSPIVGLGSPVNNRQGAAINTDLSIGKLKFNGGLGIFSEIEPSVAGISYLHSVNSETISRINLFSQNWGPYNSLNSNYRRVFEEVNLSDGDALGNVDYKKYFNTIELQTKYNATIFNKNLYFFTLTSINSCQKSLKTFPVFSDEALINQTSFVTDLSLEINHKAVLVMSYGMERVIGNELTDLGDNQTVSSTNPFFESLGLDSFHRYTLNRNQRNRLFGIGIDYKIADNAILFLRQNFYRFKDPNFVENHLQGTETMVELKINF